MSITWPLSVHIMPSKTSILCPLYAHHMSVTCKSRGIGLSYSKIKCWRVCSIRGWGLSESKIRRWSVCEIRGLGLSESEIKCWSVCKIKGIGLS